MKPICVNSLTYNNAHHLKEKLTKGPQLYFYAFVFSAKDYPWGDRYQKNRANLWQVKYNFISAHHEDRHCSTES